LRVRAFDQLALAGAHYAAAAAAFRLSKSGTPGSEKMGHVRLKGYGYAEHLVERQIHLVVFELRQAGDWKSGATAHFRETPALLEPQCL
jgi:hypothetical protein